MFTGLMNSIDQLYLTFCQGKLQDSKNHIDKAMTERDNLKVALKRLLEIKHARSTNNVVYCNKIWIGLEQVDRMTEAAEKQIVRLTRDEYEKYGSKCAAIKRRIAIRDAKSMRNGLFDPSVT